MQPIDVAAAIHLAAVTPHRTLIEEIVMTPTFPRNMDEELRVARAKGSPE
jgi:hypothetical protein